MVRVKICGIKTQEDAHAATAAGADELGFHVELEGGRSPLAPERAAEMIAALSSTVSSVMVTSVVEPGRLIKLAKTTGANVLQLYGDATPEQIRAVKVALPSIKVWKVLNVSDESSVTRAKEYEGAADAIALDTLNKTTGVSGGTGEMHDWSISKRIVESVSVPVILAGGLNPDNVAEAIKTVKPHGVDVNSGVSNPDGSKGIGKVEAFIEAAKSA